MNELNKQRWLYTFIRMWINDIICNCKMKVNSISTTNLMFFLSFDIGYS